MVPSHRLLDIALVGPDRVGSLGNSQLWPTSVGNPSFPATGIHRNMCVLHGGSIKCNGPPYPLAQHLCTWNIRRH